MASSSEVTPGLRYVWRTDRPLEESSRESSIFSFLNTQWKLEMHYGGVSYWILLQKMTAWNDFPPFEVTTWIEDERREFKPIHFRKITVTSAEQWIWGIRQKYLLKEMPDFKDSGEFTVVCMLHAVPLSGSKKESNDMSIQSSLEFPPDLESLSFDLGNLLEKGIIPDVELECGDSTIQAHKAVLAARSEFFSSEFRNKMKNVIEMPQIQPMVLDLLLKYIYTGTLAETAGDLLPSLYEASITYGIQGLKKTCSEWMIGALTVENSLGFLALADAHSDVHFKNNVVQFVVQNKQVVGSGAWSRFENDHPRLANVVYQEKFVQASHSSQPLLHE